MLINNFIIIIKNMTILIVNDLELHRAFHYRVDIIGNFYNIKTAVC